MTEEEDETRSWRMWALRGFEGWLNRVEKFLKFYPLEEEERRQLVVLNRRLTEILDKDVRSE